MRLSRPIVLALIALILLSAACAHQVSPPKPQSGAALDVDCDAALCVISQNTWQNHIEPRHCTANCQADNKSIFIAAYCGSQANAVSFCQALMARPDCNGVNQANGRVAFTATFAANVGVDSRNACNNTTAGTVIYDPNTKQVVTQFPGLP